MADTWKSRNRHALDHSTTTTSDFLVWCCWHSVMQIINLHGWTLDSLISISDGGVWRNSELASDLASGDADIPAPTPLPGRDVPFPHVIVADEAFPLNTYLMRPYARRNQLTREQRVFNYRLSRARLCIENTFGILVSRWHILHNGLRFSVANTQEILKALVCLHNFIMSSNDNNDRCASQYCPPDWLDVEDEAGLIHDGRWRTIGPGAFFKELGRTGANRGGSESEGVRNYLKEYFVSPVGEAQVPWQYVTAFQGQIINSPA
ncbi:uncharacterized protein [Temnothorax nylanderi]|uniref:uncharacterized protein n=1 Tax=Temnothorax nylanderi TaxID=102681 RepID=UPI003A864BAA